MDNAEDIGKINPSLVTFTAQVTIPKGLLQLTGEVYLPYKKQKEQVFQL